MSGWSDAFDGLATCYGDGEQLIVMLTDIHGLDDDARELARALHTAERRVLVPDVLRVADAPPVAHGAPPQALEAGLDAVGDGPALQLLSRVAAGASMVVGVGLGASLAIKLGAAGLQPKGIVAIEPRLLIPTLDAKRPSQPMDFVHGLRSPIQLHFADNDPLVQPEHIAAFQQRLRLQELMHQCYVHQGVGRGFLWPSSPNYNAGVASTARRRVDLFIKRLGSAPTTQ